MRVKQLCSLVAAALFASPVAAQSGGNLLRNGEFQDDWITLLPETKNHHWCFSSEFYNRRDYNPDCWYCKGHWDWLNADGPRGERKLVLDGPGAEIVQRVNWFAIHDDREISGFPDAGGFPAMKAARSRKPERLMRDLELTVWLAGTQVPAGAGTIDLGVCPPGGIATSDPMGTMEPPTIVRSVAITEGTSRTHKLTVVLTAADWLKAARDAAAKDPKEAAEVAKSGLALPATVMVAIRYTGKTGRIWVRSATLLAADSAAPNLLPNGGFEDVDKAGYPVGWTKALKYRYFPPRHYYIFNTWHNTNFPNRGFAAADSLLPRFGKHSLRMIVPSGDEQMVLSDPVKLNQKEPRLIEVSAWVMTDQLCMLQIDATDEKGTRLDCFNFIHKAPVSIGTDGWRKIRQVFRPRTPVQSLRLALCARGTNGYTLDDTSQQPQSNVVGHIWWDEVRLSEPESDAAEARSRGIEPVSPSNNAPAAQVLSIDVGERQVGSNVLRVGLHFTGDAKPFGWQWQVTAPSGKVVVSVTTTMKPPSNLAKGTPITTEIVYVLPASGLAAYSEYHGKLTLLDAMRQPAAASELWFGTGPTPIDLQLGGLCLQPAQKQLVRLNLGLTQATLSTSKAARLELVRRGTGQVLKTWDIDATPKALQAHRERIPTELRGDLANLLLIDVDVSFLPIQPFADPQRNWFIRATVIDMSGTPVATVDSPPFCRLAHEPPQPAIQSVGIKGDMVHINGQPWMPFGVCYGHTPVYAGPADPGPGKYRDLHNLPGWSMYDRHNSESSNRKQFDFNCMRYVAGSITDSKVIAKRWQDDNLYCSSAFVVPTPAFSLDEMFKQADGKDKLAAYLAMCKTSPAIVSVAPGIEEAFGLFQGATPAQLKGLEEVVAHVKAQSGKPVMVGHGGYWNRFEFEKVPFFDIFDPETEPLYPANIHTDLAPLVRGKDKVVWLRPQMYESVPYERWRFHTYVELMRGCRGWQIAHGPGDASLFRGLHGELEFWKPIVASPDAGPKIAVEPPIEHWSRRHQGKLYIIAATTHGIPLGQWQWSNDAPPGTKRSRLTQDRNELRDETNAYGIGGPPESGPAIHGIQYLPDARAWKKGTRLVFWVKPGASPPKNLVVLAKADGRWTHAASWGKADLGALRKDPTTAYWFLNSFYRHAKGFLGWGMDLLPKSLAYIPDRAVDHGAIPVTSEWVKLEVPLDQIGAVDKLLDGVGFMHEGGSVLWGRTTLVAPDGTETLLLGDALQRPATDLTKVVIRVPGLAKGSKVRVLFEDRELTADDGFFVDDFRGQDLYQRYGGGTGYGADPVALHLYEVHAN
jgi:hypothetical protein